MTKGRRLGIETSWARSPDAAGSPPSAVLADGAWGRLLGATGPVVLTRREHRDAFAAFDVLIPARAGRAGRADARVRPRRRHGAVPCGREPGVRHRGRRADLDGRFAGGIGGAERAPDRGADRTQRRAGPVRGPDARRGGRAGARITRAPAGGRPEPAARGRRLRGHPAPGRLRRRTRVDGPAAGHHGRVPGVARRATATTR